MTEPDAWRFIETIQTIDEEEKESEQATLYHPKSNRFQYYMTDSHDVEIKERLFAESTIREEAEKLSEAPYTRSHTDKSGMSTKEAAYFEKGFAAAISQIQEAFKQENGENR